jgi:hypothetical protein
LWRAFLLLDRFLVRCTLDRIIVQMINW